MLILKIVCSKFVNENRDKRELSVCQELGMTVKVMAKGEAQDEFKEDRVDGFDVYRFSTRPLGRKLPESINRIVSLFTWAHYTRTFNADIISGHDISGLLIGYISNLLKPKSRKAKLVYDAHEFEIGRSGNRSAFTKWIVPHMEKFLMKRCVFSTVVNDAIADELQRMYKLRERPVVVRSTPSIWKIDPDVCQAVRKNLFEKFGGEYFLLMYHGGVLRGRGIETLLQAVQVNKRVCFIILGNGEETYISELKSRVEELDITDRVIFHEAVALTELWKFIGASDVGMITIPATSLSYYHMLPNKFFENIQSETPVIASNFPVISQLINQYGIGLLCDPENPETILNCIDRMMNDKAFYVQCLENIRCAKQELCWEKESVKLRVEYENLSHQIANSK